jgi:hypothetical protein
LEKHPEYRPSQSSNGSCIDAIKVALMNSVQPLHENGLHDDHTGYGELRALDWINEVTSTAPTC